MGIEDRGQLGGVGFLFFTMWVPGIEPKSSGLAAFDALPFCPPFGFFVRQMEYSLT